MKKNKLILLQIFIAITLICTSVYAVVNASIELKVSADTVYRGDTVSVTLSLKDIGAEEKIESIEGYINYNKEVIEPITADNIQKEENNTIKIGNQVLPLEDVTNVDADEIPDTSSAVAFNGKPASEENDSRIVIDFKEPITEDTDILTINFKVKSNATIGEINNAITYSMFIVTSSANEKTREITENVKLTIRAVQNDDDDNDTNTNTNDDKNTNSDKDTNKNTNTNTNKNTNTNTNKNTNTNTNRNTNTSTNTNTNKNTNSNNAVNNSDGSKVGSVLPATGARVIIVPIVILIIVAYVCYNRYIKYKDV